MLVLLVNHVKDKGLLRLLRCKTCQILRRLYQTRSTVSKDATLFYHDRRRFFRLVGLASSSQFLFWIYLAHFQYTMKPQLLAEKEKLKSMDLDWSKNRLWKIANFVERSPVILPILGISVGVFLSVTGWIYCLRNVNRIMLLSGGRSLRLVTHTPLGGTRSVTVPVNHVSSMGSRIDKNTQIAVKVKGHKLFFIVDKEGNFVQPSLFDSIVGVKRSL